MEDEIKIPFLGVDVSAAGIYDIGMIENTDNPTWYFNVTQTLVMKAIPVGGAWTTPPIMAVGFNPNRNNLLNNQNLSNVPLRGRSKAQPQLWAFEGLAPGTTIGINISQAGVINVAGTPQVDIFLVGFWYDITQA